MANSPDIDYRLILSYPLSQKGVEAKIKSNLGYPHRVVELTDFQMAGVISDALLLFNRYKVRELFGILTHVSGRRQVTIDNADVFDIPQVDFLDENIVDYDNLNVFELDFRIKNLKGGSGDYFEYRMMNDMNKRAFSSDPEWVWDPNTRVLLIHANGGPYTVQYTMAIQYVLSTIPRQHVVHFMRFAEAYAKIRLFEIRSKTPLMMPTGTSADNTSDLKASADKLLEDTIRDLAEPAAPVIG